MRSGPEPQARSALVLCVLALLGAALACYLSAIHYGLLFGHLGLGAVCGAGPGADCDAVLASRYATFAGLPLSIWGLAFYLGVAGLALWSTLVAPAHRVAALRGIAVTAVAALAVDAWLGWVQWARLERHCVLCIATYAVNAAILAVAVRGAKPRAPAAAPGRRAAAIWVIAGTVLTLAITVATAWTLARRAEQAEARQLEGLLGFLRANAPVAIDVGDRPARGPANAPVTLVLFSDFMCEQCRRMSRYLEIVAANHRDDLRVVYVHLPADSSCNPGLQAARHPGACRLSLAAEAAHGLGKFWPFHDAVFAGEAKVAPERIADYAARAGLDAAMLESRVPEASARVEADAALARALEVDVTPTLFYNGRAVAGVLEPWMMERAIQAVREADRAR